ncbi:MAG: choice-of-anchor L domain-containing protein [Lewinellaceae bacterium]|nr:choice-of-anchor L domain-containing protein [Lewinellaceae bacterium]
MKMNCTTVFHLLLLLVLSAVGSQLVAQPLEVSNSAPITPENLITNVFLGEGVEVLNVQYQGAPAAVGFFKNGDDEVGIGRGIVMSTGNAVSSAGVIGVDGIGSQQSSSTTFGASFDPDMAQIAGGNATNDMVKYIITFVPISDTLRFRYVFASEEYPEYACTAYNDIFGFFISGPGINGPYTNNAANIARVPGTNLPVTINNVNPGVVGSAGGNLTNCTPPAGSLAYSQYYNSNNGQPNQPVYDGFTDVFTAEAVVMPCSTYTIKLVICDVSDSGWDSGVFLEAKSFGTGSLNVEATTVSLDGSVAEGCAEGILTFSLPTRVESDYPIDYNILGTAVNGVDYAFIPPDLFIPAGDSLVSVPIIAFEDDMIEGTETILIDVQRDPCNRDTIVVSIKDNPLVPADLGADHSICQGDTVQLDGTLDVPLPEPLTFYNDDTLTIFPSGVTLYSNIQAFGVLPPYLAPGVIQSVCIEDLQHNWVDDLRMYLISPGGQFMELVTDIGNPGDDFIGTCFTPEATTNINTATIGNQPFTGEWAPEGFWEDLYGNDKLTNGTWRLSLYDKFAPDIGVLNRWSITFNPIYEISYSWLPTQGLSCTDCPDPQAFPDTTTTYIMTATDSYGCSTYDTVTIEVLQRLEAPQLSCAIVTDNSITVAWPPVAGATDYEVNVDNTGWVPANGANQHTVGGLPLSTSVNVQVRAVGFCPGFEASVDCATPDCTPPLVTLNAVADASCYGSSDGALTISAIGGVAPYSYSLNGLVSVDGSFTGLAAGTYEAQALDDTGCPGILQIVVGQPDSLEAAEVVAPVSCNGLSDGTATLAINGGIGPFSFDWNGGQVDSIATGLAAGLYTVDVSDANNCSFTYEIEVPQPDSITLALTADPALCNGAADGSASVSASGGAGNYVYDFGPGVATGASPNIAVGLAVGQYEVTVSDANGCQALAAFEILEPEALQVQTSTTDVDCYGTATGTAVAMASGGTGSYQYSWVFEGTDTLATGPNASGLPAGQYVLQLSDANDCSLEGPFAITQPDSLALSASVQDASCDGVEDGTVSLEATGGIPSYTFNWSDIGSGPGMRETLGAGAYQVSVTDNNGCQAVLNFEVASPQALTLEFASMPVSCFEGMDGQASVAVEGGTGSYTYQWGDGQMTPTAIGLGAGIASVLIIDGNGCEAEGSIEVEAPAELVVVLQGAEPACNGDADGSITALPGGGVGGYTFSWSGGQTGPVASGFLAGIHGVTVTDANGCTVEGGTELGEPEALSATTSSEAASCNPTPDGTATINVQGGTPNYTYLWSSGAGTATANSLTLGEYYVTVTDANGCTITDTATVDGIPSIELSISGSGVSCNGGSDGRAAVVANGGFGAYTYNWGPGQPNASQIGNIPSGNYIVTVTDEIGCTAMASIFIGQPDALVLDTEMQMVACSGGADGSLSLSVRGGIAPYSILWSNGATGTLADSLAVGTYTVTVTDNNNCIASATSSVTEASPIAVNVEIGEVECYGANTGSADVLVSGGVQPYSYAWSNGASTASLLGVVAGAYTLSITDGAGCVVAEEVDIPQPGAPLSAGVQAYRLSCYGANDGRLEIGANGGTPSYRYSLDGQFFSGSSTFIRLEPGNYRVLIQDANGCTFLTDEVWVGEPEPINVDLGDTRAADYGKSLVLEPEIQGGIGALSYEWFPQDSSLLSCFYCFSPEVRPEYQVTVRLVVTDEDGCTGTSLVTVYPKKDRPIFVPTGFTPNGDNHNDLLLVHARSDVEMTISFFRVYDRWGELLFEISDFMPNDPAMGWDGNFREAPAQAGLYIWHVGVEFPDHSREEFTGQTTLIR